MRKLLFIIFISTFFTTFAQSYGDGCMRVRFVATWAWNEEFEDPFDNDESNWQWWFSDVGNFDGLGWAGGNCLAQGGFFQIGWWDHSDVTIYDYTYGTAGPNAATVPQTYSLRGHYEGDDCGGSCDYCTSLFDDDDYRYDETVSSGINYRFAPPNSNNSFQRFTSWHGSSDYGGEFYVNYTSPRPLVSSNVSQICFGQTTAVTFNFTGAIFGGNYVMVDDVTNAVVYNASGASTTLNLNSARTFRVYTSNGGVRSLCYSLITINTYLCTLDFNCLTTSLPGGTVNEYSTNGSLAGGRNVETSYFVSNLPVNSYIVDVNVPATGGYSPSLMELQHNNTVTSTSVVSLPSGFVNLRADVIYDLWWDNPGTATTAGTAQIQVCACKTADFGIAAVNGNASGITICQDDPGNISLTHNGSVTTFDNEGYGDELRWFSGSCGGTYLGSGLTLSIPSPTSTTTYYASFYINGQPCRGANSYCESVTVTVNPLSLPGTITPSLQTICVNGAATNLGLAGYTGVILSWEYSADGGGTWGLASGSTSSASYSLAPYQSLPGTHTFRALVQNGVCSPVASAPVELIVNPNPLAGILNPNPISICSDSIFTINANGYLGSLQWQVSSVNGTSGFSNIPGQNSPSFASSITNGSLSDINRWYRIAVTNAPCAATVFSTATQVTINPITIPGSVSGLQDTICEGENPGNLSLTGQTGSIQSWIVRFNGGAFSNIANTNSNYAPGTLNSPGLYQYAAIVKSGDCDVDTSSLFSVRVLSDVQVSIAGPITVCQNLSVNLTASPSAGNGVYTYQWQRNGVNVGSNSASYTTDNSLSPGTYNYSVIVSSGPCSSTSAVHQVIVHPQPVISNITSQNLNCFEVNIGSINITASADSFSINNGTSYSTSNSFTGLSAGSYTVVVKNTFSCINTYIANPIVITQPDSIAITLTPNNPNCANSNDGSISVGAIGGVPPYEYAINGGAYQSGSTFSSLAPGSYTISVRDDNGCIYTSNTNLNAVYPNVLVSISGANEVCQGSSITLTANASGGNGSYAYQWQRNGVNVGGNSASYSTETSLSPNIYNYTVIVNSSTCQGSSANFQVIVNPIPVISNVSSQNLACYNVNIGSINITATADSFSINNGVNYSTSNSFTSLPAGTYNVVVKNTFGCSASYSGNPLIISQPDSITINLSATNPNCINSADGEILINATGGTPPYEYSLNGGSYQSGNVFSSLAPGSYTVSVRDDNACIYSNSTILSSSYTFDLAIDSFKNVSCPGSADAFVQLGTTGGVAPFTFSLDNSNYQLDSSFNNLVAGPYTFYAEDNNGCSDFVNLTIVESPPINLLLDSVSQISCFGANDAAIYVSASGSTPPYTYEWILNGALISTNEDLNNIGPGSYNLTVNTTSSCIASLAVVIIEPSAVSITNPIVNNVSCNGQTNGSIQVSVSGGTPGYTFEWEDASNTVVASTQSLSNQGAGTYTLTVSDQNECIATTTATITEPAALSVAAVTSDPSCSNSNNGTISVSVSGGTTSYSYSLNGGAIQSSNVFNGLGAGTYTINVSDANGCTATGNAILSNQYSVSLAVQSQTNVSCSGQNDGSVTLQATGGQAPLSYTINGANAQTSNVFTGLAPGFYTFEMIDQNGCSASVSTSITSNPPMVLMLDSTLNVDCNGQNTGAIYTSVQGGTSPYNFTLNGGASQANGNFTSLASGAYIVEVEDNNGCTESINVVISSPTALNVSVIGSSNVSCNGQTNGSIQVSVSGGTPGYTFEWEDASNTVVASTQNLSNQGAGTYTLTVSDQNGCIATTTATITEPAALSVAAVTSDPSCSNSNNGTISVSVSGGTTAYSYSLNGGAIQSSNVFNGLGAGTYTINVSDANGCTATGNAILSNQYSVSLAVQSQTNVSCSGQNDGSVTLQATGGQAPLSYTINGANAQTSNVFTGLAPGFYTFEMIDQNGCSASVSTSITSNPPMVLVLDSTLNVDCNGQNTGAIYTSVQGGASPYNFTLNGGASQANGNFTSLASGAYIVEVEDNNGCSESINVVISSPTALNVSVTGSSNVSCNGQTNGSIQVNVSGGTPGYTFEWEDASNTVVASTQNLSNQGAGTYTLTVTDQNGCIATTTATITEPAALSVAAVTSDPSCSNSNNGTISVSVSGGTAAYSYSLNGGAIQSSNVFNGLGAGTYTINVSDANGCTATGNAILSNQYSVSLAVQSQTNVSCSGQNDGSVTLQATGGQAPLSYTINGANAQTSNVFTGLAPGFYTFEMIDQNGCSASVSTTITSNLPLVVVIDSIVNLNCANSNTGAIYITASGGDGSYTFVWSNNTFLQDLVNVSAGTYTLQVIDGAGCSISVSATIASPNPLSLVVANFSNILCAGNADAYVDVSVAGGNPPYTFSWSNGVAILGNTEDLYNLPIGNYTLTVTDSKGCVALISQSISGPNALVGSISTTDELCFGDELGTATANVSGGTAPYNYLWSTFESAQSIDSLPSGVIGVIVTDANNCQLSLSATVNGPLAALSIDLIRLTNVSCFGGNNGEIQTSISGGTAPYTLVWAPGGMSTPTIDSLIAGIYTLTVTDANGCVVSRTFIVTQPPQIISSVSVTNPSCYGQETGLALIGASGGNPPFVYEWNTNPVQTGALANNLAGDTSYVVSILDSKGCLVYDTATLVNPTPMTINTTAQGVSCIASENGSVAVEVLGGNAPYTYQLNGFMQLDSVFDNLAVGNYVVFVLDNNNCNASSQFEIIQNQTLEIELSGAGLDGVYFTDEIFIVRGEEVNLLTEIINSGVGIADVTYIAPSSANLDYSACPSPCLSPSLIPEQTLTVTVNVTDTNGCAVQDTLLINVSDEALIFMPNAFTPNGDCLNDYFEINILGATSLDVRIFNRWGEELFHNPNQQNGLSNPDAMEAECLSGSINPRQAWDGTYNGEAMPNGAYTYQVTFTLFDGTVETMSGTITILR